MTTANIESFIIDGCNIEVVNNFNFLGSTIERTVVVLRKSGDELVWARQL